MARRRIADELDHLVQAECMAAARALADVGDVHARVHAARKAIRRARAVLALVDRGGGPVADADRLLQRVGESLSRLRDAHAAIDTATALARHDDAGLWTPVVDGLRRRAARVAARTLALDPAFQRRRSALARAAACLRAMDWGRVRRRSVRRALRDQRRRVRKARRRACRDHEADALHRWRRRARRLRMQLKAVPAQARRAGIQAASGRHARALHALIDALGWRQDLQVLAHLLPRLRGLPVQPAAIARLHALQARVGLP